MSVFHSSLVPYTQPLTDPVVQSADFASSYLYRTPALTGNSRKWTWSGWLKRNVPGNSECLFSSGVDNDSETYFRIDDDDRLHFQQVESGYYKCIKITNAAYRDVESWYHILVSCDTQNASPASRLKIYVNGEEVTDLVSGSTYNWSYAQDAYTYICSTNTQYIGGHFVGSGSSLINADTLSSKLADVYLIDNQVLAPSDFARTEASGKLIPITYVFNAADDTTYHLDFNGDGQDESGILIQSNNANGDTVFEDSSAWGSAVTATGGAVHKTTVGNPHDENGSAIHFPNTNSTLSIPNGTLNAQSNDWSVEFWLYFTEFTGYQTILDYNYIYGDSMLIQCATSGGSALRLYQGSTVVGTESTSASLDTWHYYEIKSRANWVKMARDGVTQAFHSTGASWIDGEGEAVFFGAKAGTSSHPFYGYMYDIRIKLEGVVDGNTPTPTAPFESESLLHAGADSSGNQNHFNIYGAIRPLTVGYSDGYDYDITNDSPSKGLNYCTLNPKWNDKTGVVYEGNWKSTGENRGTHDAMNHASYWEVKTWMAYGETDVPFGVIDEHGTKSTVDLPGYGTNAYYGFRLSAAGTLEYTSNGSSWTSIATGLSGPQFPYVSGNASVSNFGQAPYAFSVPAGYYSLNTLSIPDSPVATATKHFDIKTFGGTGAQTFGNGGMQPDLCWLKDREGAYSFHLVDSVRGVGKSLSSDSEDYEAEESEGLTAFGSDGFTVGSNSDYSASSMVAWCWKAGTTTYANTSYDPTADFSIMTWTGDGEEDDGNDGHLDSSQDILHRLSGAPEFIMAANRTINGASYNNTPAADGFYVWHKDGGDTSGAADHLLTLSDNSASKIATGQGMNSLSGPIAAVDSTKISFNNGETDDDDHFYLNYGGNYDSAMEEYDPDSDDYVAYAWRGVKGFSKFGKFNGETAYVHLGFRPKFLLWKNCTSQYWGIVDSVRGADSAGQTNLFNPRTNFLYPSEQFNEANAGITDIGFDFLSNGFQAVGTNAINSTSGGKFIYAAFAGDNSPFKNSNGV